MCGARMYRSVKAWTGTLTTSHSRLTLPRRTQTPHKVCGWGLGASVEPHAATILPLKSSLKGLIKVQNPHAKKLSHFSGLESVPISQANRKTRLLRNCIINWVRCTDTIE